MKHPSRKLILFRHLSVSQNWQYSLRAIPSSTGTSSPVGDRSLFSPLSVFMLSRGWKMKVRHVFPKQFSPIAKAVPFFPPSASPVNYVNCCISILALTSSVAVLPHDVDTSQAVPADGVLLKNFGNSIATSGLWPSKFSRRWLPVVPMIFLCSGHFHCFRTQIVCSFDSYASSPWTPEA